MIGIEFELCAPHIHPRTHKHTYIEWFLSEKPPINNKYAKKICNLIKINEKTAKIFRKKKTVYVLASKQNIQLELHSKSVVVIGQPTSDRLVKVIFYFE